MEKNYSTVLIQHHGTMQPCTAIAPEFPELARAPLIPYDLLLGLGKAASKPDHSSLKISNPDGQPFHSKRSKGATKSMRDYLTFVTFFCLSIAMV